jgi:hypothetical protein
VRVGRTLLSDNAWATTGPQDLEQNAPLLLYAPGLRGPHPTDSNAVEETLYRCGRATL